MTDPSKSSEIQIIDFREDTIDDAAFGITCEVKGPKSLVATVRVSFEEEFVRTYFKIPWHKDLASEESKIITEKRDLFVQWALVKIEHWLDRGAPEDGRKMRLTREDDQGWASKIDNGSHCPASKEKLGSHDTYIYEME